jgi:excisionase family DNA binding protein
MSGGSNLSGYRRTALPGVSATRLPIIGGRSTLDANNRTPLLFDDMGLPPPREIGHGPTGVGRGARRPTARDGNLTSAAADQEDLRRPQAPVGGDSDARTPASTPPLLLTVRQVEAALQLGRTRTYELLRSGQLPTLRVGRLIRVSRVALEEWIAQQVAAGCG